MVHMCRHHSSFSSSSLFFICLTFTYTVLCHISQLNVYLDGSTKNQPKLMTVFIGNKYESECLLIGRTKGWYIWYCKIDFLHSRVLDCSGHAGVKFAVTGTTFWWTLHLNQLSSWFFKLTSPWYEREIKSTINNSLLTCILYEQSHRSSESCRE